MATTSEITTITLPKLAGSRNSGAVLASEVPFQSTVIIDATENKSAAQGYIDELCKQLIENIQVEHIIVKNSVDVPRLQDKFNLSAKNRNFTERISYED